MYRVWLAAFVMFPETVKVPESELIRAPLLFVMFPAQVLLPLTF